MLTNFLSDDLSVLNVIILIVISLAGGVLFSVLYSILKKKDGYYKDMVIAYSIFPFLLTSAIIGVTLLTQGFNGTELTSRISRVGVAILSALIILRFRSEQRNFEDLTYILFLTIFAFVLGIGYLGFALVLYVLTIVVLVLLYALKFPRIDQNRCVVTITVPENLNYPEAFNEVFDKFCVSYKLSNVKTADLGSVFIIKYNVTMKNGVSQKEFIDEIRIRNSNLNVTLYVADFKGYKEV